MGRSILIGMPEPITRTGPGDIFQGGPNFVSGRGYLYYRTPEGTQIRIPGWVPGTGKKGTPGPGPGPGLGPTPGPGPEGYPGPGTGPGPGPGPGPCLGVGLGPGLGVGPGPCLRVGSG